MTKILISGASGFVGKNLLKTLNSKGFNLLTPNSKELDLTNQTQTNSFFEENRPEITIHLAGMVGGIGINKLKPADFFYHNAMMGLNILNAAFVYGSRKFVGLAAGCGYPRYAKVPMKEEDFWSGWPDDNSYGYSMAKKNLIVHALALKEQYGFNSTILIPANLYGTYDNFDLRTSHVVPAILRKVYEAKKKSEKSIKVWGSGTASREFLFVQDLAFVIKSSIYVNDVGPYNVGTGVETSIRSLIETTFDVVDYTCHIDFERDKPDGQMRRFFDTQNFFSAFGFVPKTELRVGLEKTYQWYTEEYLKKKSNVH